METNLFFRYSTTAPDTGPDGPQVPASSAVRLGYGVESNQLDQARFEVLYLEGTLDAWFKQIHLMGLWLMLSSDGLRPTGDERGFYAIDGSHGDGPGRPLHIQAELRTHQDFEEFALALIPHLSMDGTRYL